MRPLRQDAGSVAMSMRVFAQFLLTEAEYHSKLVWDASHETEPSKDTWQKAVAFRGLFNTAKVREHKHGGIVYHCCKQRTEGKREDVSDRDVISKAETEKAFRVFQELI